MLIKIGLQDLSPVTFAGLRYTLAFLFLLALPRRPRAAQLRGLPSGTWVRLLALGLLFYSVTQGAQFVGLAYLPAVTVNLLFAFSPVIVAALGVLFLGERLGTAQWTGVLLTAAGAWAYFAPARVPAEQVVGVAAAVVGMLANSGSAILGRDLNRRRDLDPYLITTVSMGLGGPVLLLGGLAVEGLPNLRPHHWLLILWLAAVNTALAFTLWNRSLRELSAAESSVINSTLIIQIPILAWLFLGERFGLREAAGLWLVAAGVVLTQLRGAGKGASVRSVS